VLDFAEPERGCSLAFALETGTAGRTEKPAVHYGFHMTIKDWNPRIRLRAPGHDRRGGDLLQGLSGL
jgi:dihydropyrimidinase